MELCDHYDNLAPSFATHWAYSDKFVQWMVNQLAQRLRPRPTDVMADIGSGPGMYAAALAELCELNRPVTCVEPSNEMVTQLTNTPALHPVHQSAETFAEAQKGHYDAILAKEVLHHVQPAHRAEVLSGLAQQVRPGGRLLVVMLPTRLEHPLFAAALERYSRNSSFTPDYVADRLAAVGMKVDLTYRFYPVTMSTSRWLDMVGARYMSLLTHFTDAELDQGIDEIRQNHPEPEVTFTDRYAFILGAA